jgi:hypothetical protein
MCIDIVYALNLERSNLGRRVCKMAGAYAHEYSVSKMSQGRSVNLLAWIAGSREREKE